MSVGVGTILPAAGTLTGADVVDIVRGTIPLQTTVQDIANLAPVSSATFLVKTATAALSAERVVKDGTTVAPVWTTPGEVSFEVVAASLTAAKLGNALADAFVVFTASASVEVLGVFTITVQAKDIQGNNLAVATNFAFTLYGVGTTVAALDIGATTGAFVMALSDAPNVTSSLYVTDATGAAVITVGSGTPLESYKTALGASPGTPFIQAPAVLTLTFAAP